ncbi:MAG TPA: TauD/TfdA family dioxygenase, partial [Burkholderiaceae bacterium]|nr:TauD/TfdA family dioxygenase [Burkholderiaceae bacterium]
MKIVPTDKTLGARILDIDLSQPLSEQDYKAIEQALGRYGVVSFPKQQLTARQLRDFSEHFGKLEINVANMYHEPNLPEV